MQRPLLALSLALTFCLGAHGLGPSSARADPLADQAAKELEALIKSQLAYRTPKRILKLLKEKKKKGQKGKPRRRYVYTPRGLKKLWSATPKAFRDAFDLQTWSQEVSKRHHWLGIPLVAEEASVERVVVHREFASVFWKADHLKPSKGFRTEAMAAKRLTKSFPAGGKREFPSSVWTKVGKDWTVSVRPTPQGKWEEVNLGGDALRSAPEGFPADGVSATKICALITANEDAVRAANNDRALAKRLDQELKASMSGVVIWDVGLLEYVKTSGGGGMHPGRALTIRVGHAVFVVWDASVGTDEHYAKLKAGTVVAFRGTFFVGSRGGALLGPLEQVRSPYKITLRWPRSKAPAVMALPPQKSPGGTQSR